MWTADAAVFRQRTLCTVNGMADTGILSGGADGHMYESWTTRQKLKADERKASIAAATAKLEAIKAAILKAPKIAAARFKRVGSKSKAASAASAARARARRTGATTYRGQTCIRGHDGIRNTTNGNCLKCDVEKQRERRAEARQRRDRASLTQKRVQTRCPAQEGTG